MGWHAWVGTLMQSFSAREYFHTPHPSRCYCWPPDAAAAPTHSLSSRWPPSLPPASHTCTAARPYKGQKVQLRDPETLRFRGREPLQDSSSVLTHQKLLPGPYPPAYGQHPHPQELGRAARSPRLQYVSVHHAQLVPVEGREVGTEGGHEGCRQLEGGSKQRDARCE